MGSRFTIRPFASIDEFKECVRFQEETWGKGFSDLVAVAILKVSQRLGGSRPALTMQRVSWQGLSSV